MVELLLKVVDLDEPLETQSGISRTELDYKQEIMEMLRFYGAQGGIDLDEMEKALDVRAIIKSADAGSVVKMEKSQLEYILKRLSTFKFVLADMAFITFRKDLKAALEKG